MAALCTGISYGLSQSCLTNDNKDLIFVKLTDSAYRAIEEYQKNQKKLSSPSTIQFRGNEGYLSFPSLSKNGGEKFSFSITETEGLQGSFECIQQVHNQLEVLGALPNKMRIHANEDVYEATRHRMAVAEETQKNKCTREIKPNQKDIGRKVKVKPSNNRLSNIPNNNVLNKQRDSSSSFVNSSSTSLINNINNNHNSLTALSLKNNNNNSNNNNNNSSNSITSTIHQQQPQQQQQQQQPPPTTTQPQQQHGLTASASIAATVAAAAAAAASTGTGSTTSSSSLSASTTTTTMPISTNNSPLNVNVCHTTANGSLTGGLVPSRVANNSSSNSSGRGAIPDIMKRPIKERLIHLLALRPYKKPELFARIKIEGIRERERNLIGTLLKTISFIRDNTYHLHRHIWNDVHEDWPFYTEQDRQCLKRRKPQNLTPPLSSDGGSSTSGQSPTSTHNGSPPPAVKRPPLNSDKYSDGPTSKKQRISHFRKEITHDNNRLDIIYSSRMPSVNDKFELLQNNLNVGNNNDNNDNNRRRRNVVDSRDSANLNPRSREHHLHDDMPMRNSNYYGSSVTPTNAPESEDSGLSLSFNVLSADVAKRISTSSSSTGEQDNEKDSYDEDINILMQQANNTTNTSALDFSKYSRITSVEQRRQYKSEFDSDFVEYRNLFAETERVSSLFTQLEDQLRKEQNEQKYKDIQRQIVHEYRNTLGDPVHQNKKARFHYLHHKLSHIKHLVNEFDALLTAEKRMQKNY